MGAPRQCIGPAATLMQTVALRDAGTFGGPCITDALEQSPALHARWWKVYGVAVKERRRGDTAGGLARGSSTGC